ncbi:MAG: hypothetical protein Q7S22_01725 [Candidatus Micrarchaeota archaeon]|nr:hypothetical protein [Candidatus Micrarchaeota archaeon]
MNRRLKNAIISVGIVWTLGGTVAFVANSYHETSTKLNSIGIRPKINFKRFKVELEPLQNYKGSVPVESRMNDAAKMVNSGDPATITGMVGLVFVNFFKNQ